MPFDSASSVLVLAVVATLLADGVLLGILVNLRRRTPEPWLSSWTGAFALLSVAHVCVGMGLLDMGQAFGPVAANLVIGPGVWLLLRGVGQFRGRPMGPTVLAVGAVGPVAGLGVALSGLPMELAGVPGIASLGIASLVAGRTVMRTGEPSRYVAGAGLIALGIHCFDFFLVAPMPWLIPYGFLLVSMLQLVAGVGLALMLVDRIQADAAAARDDLRAFVQGAVVGVYRSTPTEGFTFANPALVAMLGYGSEAEVLALKVPEELYLDPSERGRARRSTDGTVLSGFEATWRRADGTPLVVALDGREVRDADGNVQYWEGFARDVTRARMLEGELARSQRMEALGRLAGGVAHDFNNLLTVMMGNLELIDPDRLGPDRGPVDAASTAAQRAAELTRQLLSLGRPSPNGQAVVDARAVLIDTLEVLGRTVRPRIELTRELPDGPCWVPMSNPRLSQIVMNLALNARDAMPDGGRLTTILRSGVERAELHGSWVELTVRDEGPGMSPEVLEHIFEPFFTTKEEGAGTGLGLATAYVAVRDAGGSIEAESRLGEGSTFHVYLPAAEAPRATGSHTAPTADARGTIVVVDDRDDVRAFVVRCLSMMGYTVRDHGMPTDALHDVVAEPPDLLLTDVVMPGLSGPELVQQLRDRQVEVPVLFMSGFPRPGTTEEPLPGPLLHKPFQIETLRSMVAELLAAPVVPGVGGDPLPDRGAPPATGKG